ncbi:MAG: S-layer homology domain-containing protein [Syntrophomonadaceae bacterium]|nr:S-layer homology domain-containing protein [Syntrophomonadaceae bacterium]
MIKQIKQKFLAIILAVTIVMMSFWGAGYALADSGPSDIAGHWGEKPIHSAMAQGIIKGYPDGTFRPDGPVTRAEFVAMLNTALGLQAKNTVSLVFTDVPENAWYKNEVAKASFAHYINGVSDSIFQPNRSITRQEAAVMLARILPQAGYLDQSSLSNAPDHGSISDWALSPIAVLVNKGYINGRADGNLTPRGPLTRAEAVTLLTTILEKETIIREDVYVKNAGESLANTIYVGDITIEKSVGEGDVSLKNLTALSHVYVLGGGVGTVTIEDDYIVRLVVLKEGTPVRVMSSGISTIHFSVVFNNNLLVNSQGETALVNKGEYRQIVRVEGTVNEQSGRDIIAAIEKQITSMGNISPDQVQEGAKSVLNGAEVSMDTTNIIVVNIPQAPAVAPATSISSGSSGSGGSSDDSDGSSKTIITAVAINGNARIGDALASTLTPSAATVVYQWKKANTPGGEFTDVAGAVYATYTPIAGDQGQYLIVTATGTGNYKGSVTSDAKGPVVAADPGQTPITAIGAVTGSASIGGTLTAGVLTPAGATAVYQWMAADIADGEYANINGADESVYTAVYGDYQKYLKVVATGTGSYTGTVTSDPSDRVGTGAIQSIAAISGTVKLGEILAAGDLIPVGASVYYQWKWASTTNGSYSDISGAISDTYTLAADNLGKYIKLTVTGYGAYSGSATSASTGPVVTDLTAIGNISGTLKLGETLTAGILTPPAATANYQWQRSNAADGAYTNISGATSSTYQLAAADYQKYLKVVATGTGSYVGTVTSDATGQVAAGEITAIGNISGTAKIAQTLTAGNVTPPGATVTYQWQRCDTDDGTFTNISGATSSTYTCVSDDIGKFLKVVATGTGYYSGTATSAAKGAVANYTGASLAETWFSYEPDGEYLYATVTWNDASSVTEVKNITDNINLSFRLNQTNSGGTYLFQSNNSFTFDRAYLRNIVNALSNGQIVDKEYRISFNRGNPVNVTIRFRKP